jgi:hypothetical protein
MLAAKSKNCATPEPMNRQRRFDARQACRKAAGFNKVGRANGDEPFTFVVFIGRARRLIPVAHL